MPSYLDFDSTKNFRNYVLGKTLTKPDGPQSFTDGTYTYNNLSDSPNVDPGAVDSNREDDLKKNLLVNNYIQSLPVTLIENIDTAVKRSPLKLYVNESGAPMFNVSNHTLVGIMSTSNYNNESELFRFAAYNIKNNSQGPVFSRIQQNLERSTVGRVRLIDALSGNLATATNIVTGREPLIESNYQITVAKTLPGKAIDFLQTTLGTEFPFTEIPGDYLTNPLNPIQYRPTPTTAAGAVIQDVTGAIGSLIGIQRRPKPTRKPSDLFIEYMGSGQRQNLFNLLSFSTYGPDYTTTARSQNTSKLFNFADRFAQGIKTLVGEEAPKKNAYIGDDRGDDVKFAMNDANGQIIKGNYYLSLLFDPVQSRLFERKRNIGEGGPLSGKLTWISTNSRNKLGVNNEQYQGQSSQLNETLSTKYGFREDSLLGYTQALLNTMPTDAGQAKSHIANVIDQTSRAFKEGEVFLSRGSAVMSPKQFKNKDGDIVGVEYCRTWTKDRPYFSYSDTMKKGMNLRKFDSSVMTNPWNLNIGPMSNGKKDFNGSSNIVGGYKYGPTADGKDFYAKKYMFSIENLAWRTSTLPGFTISDLPYCERGPNGGRVMWFPPYDLKVSESNAARWEENTFLGRPEPIYTYQNTSRTGQISFKIVVDHPSILNLLVREHFKNMSDDEAENYINAFFAGCEELDFYDLIRRYSTIDSSDATLIQQFLNGGKTTVKEYKRYRSVPLDPIVENGGNEDGSQVVPNENQDDNNGVTKKIRLNFENNYPIGNVTITTSGDDYTGLYNIYKTKKQTYESSLNSDLTTLLPANTTLAKQDKEKIFGKSTTEPTKNPVDIINEQVTKIGNYFDDLDTRYNDFVSTLDTLKSDLSGKSVNTVTIILNSSTSSIAGVDYNRKLSLRRSYSVIKDIFNRISNGKSPNIVWKTAPELAQKIDSLVEINNEYDLKDFGWEIDGKLIVKTKNYGELSEGDPANPVDTNCRNKDFKFVKDLSISAPISFYCRATDIDINYKKLPAPPPPPKTPPPPNIIPRTRIEEDGSIKVTTTTPKPKIDVLKRIVMKTLSECYYFKILEKESPVQFTSLKEKLRYFHPGFHSTTPEGLNSRLTFLQQCLRPGDTIPIKGGNEDSDIGARNTTFGPPPICVLRIGDFYHSKVVIRDVAITFEENVWDLNPEGIGVQPMIANVSLQVSFIGGQGIERPVERLQNALSSNFYANTEMYDERSESTNLLIGGKSADEFNTARLKELLEDFQKGYSKPPVPDETNKGNNISEEQYIGINDGKTIEYTFPIDDLYFNTKFYFGNYQDGYNNINKLYGPQILTMLFSPNYRALKEYDVYTTTSLTPGKTINIFGLYDKGKELPILVRGLKGAMIQQLGIEKINGTLSEIFKFDKELSKNVLSKSDDILYKQLEGIINNEMDLLTETTSIKRIEDSRNKLIQTLDKLNFITQYGKDGAVKGTKGTEATLSGFTATDFYNQYKDCIDNIEKNTTKMYSDLDNSIDFTNPVISSTVFQSILSYLIGPVNAEEIIKGYKNEPSVFDDKTIKKLRGRLTDFYAKPKTKDFKFTDVGQRKNTNKIIYNIQSQQEITDTNMLSNLTNLNKTPSSIPNKLNYYKTL